MCGKNSRVIPFPAAATAREGARSSLDRTFLGHVPNTRVIFIFSQSGFTYPQAQARFNAPFRTKGRTRAQPQPRLKARFLLPKS